MNGVRRKRIAGAGLAAGAALSLASYSACVSSAVSEDVGLNEPLRVASGQFLPGALPGVVPPDGSPGPELPDASPDAAPSGPPIVTDISVANTLIEPGERGLVFTGHATTNAYSVAVRFADLGTGYWVVPVGGPDPSDDGLLTWQVSADFARALPTGDQTLLFASIGAGGASGEENPLVVCVDTPVPDNGNACVPKHAPPAAVLSLRWSVPVDLDLIVEDPTGEVVGGKTSATVVSEAGVAAPSSGGTLDHDSNRDCVIDGIDQEDVVWQSTPPTGTYAVWVDLYMACGQPAASFTVTLWLAEPQPDGTSRLVQQTPPLASGVLTADQANAGATRGLYVGDFVLQ